MTEEMGKEIAGQILETRQPAPLCAAVQSAGKRTAKTRDTNIPQLYHTIIIEDDDNPANERMR